MQVILLERVQKLGQMGEVVAVRDGYARNFLIPRGRALRATKDALDDFAKRRQQLEAQNLTRRQDAEKMAGQVAGRSVVILRQASETAQLFGSVTGRDIALAFAAADVTFDKQQIHLDQPIKTLGIHEVTVALHPEVEIKVKVNVARSTDEADIQAGKVAPPEPEELTIEDLEAL